MIPKPESCIGCPLYEKPHGKKMGFSLPCGTGKSGVLVVAEALGESEEKEGMALVGKSGYAMFQQLHRVGIEREDLTLFNVVACRPPDNKLAKMPWEKEAIDHCRPNLDAVINQARAIAKINGKHFVILTLGRTAFKRILELEDKRDEALLKADYIAYPHWSQKYEAWAIAADHPAYLLRGKANLWPVLQFVFIRALEIANNGLTLDEPSYLLDPDPSVFDEWIKGYKRSLESNPSNPLSYDIETPYKKKTDESDLSKEEDADHTILRISFAYEHNGEIYTVSVKWSTEYLSGIEVLFKIAPFTLGWNSDSYDAPRVSLHVKIYGVWLDGMVAWHILNSSLPKGLGFVTPYYAQNTLMWKHLSESKPAFYNAKDSHMALVNYIGILRDLKANNLWRVFERHVIKLNIALKFMSDQGVSRDHEMRAKAEAELSEQLAKIEEKMEEAVPEEARKFKIAKKKPKDLSGWLEVVKDLPINYCGTCGLRLPKRWKKHGSLCGGVETPIPEPQICWSKPLEFKISHQGLTTYQKALKHQAVVNWREKKVTFNEDAIVKLMKHHPKDRLYPRILEHRKIQKLLSTYIGVTQADGRIKGGMDVGPDGKIHATYTHNPSTLRLACESPNMQNLPRPNPGDPSDPVNIIRNLATASPGNVLYARDYCVDPKTKILRKDLTWVCADQIRPGDELIGFDGDFSVHQVGRGQRQHNKFRPAIVKNVQRIQQPKVKVVTSRGTTIVSASHRFVGRRPKYRRMWVEAKDLLPGMIMPFLASPWETDTTRDGGYLAGFLDGEGWCHRTNTGFGQNAGPVLSNVLQLLEKRKFKLARHGRTGKCFSYASVSGIGQQLRLLGELRPTRLLGKAESMWSGRQISGPKSKNATVISVEPIVDDVDVIALETTTGTFISDGFFSHNCGIEAVLTFYFAADPGGIRLALRDIHTYYTMYALYELEGRFKSYDLPDISWPDDRLFPYLAHMKDVVKKERNTLYKHLVHAANFMQSPKGAQEKIFSETRIDYPVKQVARVMDIYFSLFPKVRQWHTQVLGEAEKDGYLRNPFDYIHRFSHVYAYKKECGIWVKTPNHDVANKVVAFKPQSTAAAIIKESILRMFYERFEEAGKFLRLQVHDENLFDIPRGSWENVNLIVKEEMERPVPELRLPESWGMGDLLAIQTEAKIDLNTPSRWGSMKGIKD